jgi:8-oxo-dGTP diphosphatase
MTRVVVVAGVIFDHQQGGLPKVLLAKRNSQQHQGDLWEFPGGKVEQDEDQQSALTRELKEELDISILQSEFYRQIVFDYSDKKVELNFYLVSKYSGVERGVEGQLIEWVPVNRLSEYQFPEANQTIVDSLSKG